MGPTIRNTQSDAGSDRRRQPGHRLGQGDAILRRTAVRCVPTLRPGPVTHCAPKGGAGAILRSAPGDAQQPGAQTGRILKSPDLTPGDDEDVLRHVVRLGPAASQHSPQKVSNRALMAFDDP